MGVKGHDALLEHFRRLARSAFHEMMDAAAEEHFRKKKGKKQELYNITRRLSPRVQFAACAIDMSSIAIQLASHAANGAEVKRRLRRIVNELINDYGAQYIAFCFDNGAPQAKQIEGERRAASSKSEPYRASVSVEGGGEPYPLEDYEFGDEIEMPDDPVRLKRTPVLLRRFNQFLATTAQEDLQISVPLAVVVCGAQFEVPGDKGATVWRARTLSSRYTTSGEVCVDEPSRPIRVGEGEGKCVYWMLRWFRRMGHLGSVYVRSNDTDSFTTLLLNAQRVLSLPPLTDPPAPAAPQARKHSRSTREIWLEWTAPSTHRRFVNITDLFRAIHAWSARSVPAPMHQHFPEAAFLCAALLGGCDYVTPIKRTGASPFLNVFVDSPKLLAANGKDKQSVCMFSSTKPMSREMFVSEGKLYELVWRALISKPGTKKVIQVIGNRHSAVKGSEKMYLIEGENRLKRMDFRQRFDFLARECERYNVRLEASNAKIQAENKALVAQGKKAKSVRTLAPEVPDFNRLCALVRRVLWSLDYYRNIGLEDPVPPHHTNPIASLNHKSIYGYSLDESGRCREATHIVEPHVLDQPFVHRVRGDLVSDTLRRRELISSTASADARAQEERCQSVPPERRDGQSEPTRQRLSRAPASAPPRSHRKRSADDIHARLDFINDPRNRDKRRAFDEPEAWEYQFAVDDPYGTNFKKSV